MEAVIIPEQPSRWDFDYDKSYKKYEKAINDFKKYVVATLFLKDVEEFDELFEIDSSVGYITLLKSGEYGRNRYKKRFKRMRPAILGVEDIDELMQYAEQRRKEIREEKRAEIVTEKAEKILKKILEKYEEDEDENKNDGFSLEFNYMRIDYPDSIYIRYKPIDKYNLQGNSKYEFTGYDKSDRDATFENETLSQFDHLTENEIIELLNREDTEYDFVITSYRERVLRFGEMVNMYILIDGTFTTPEFELDADYQKTLDNIIKLSDQCIEWQIDILEFAEKLKSEIPAKYFELANY